MMSLIYMSLMLVTVLKMAKQYFIRVYGAWGAFAGSTGHLWDWGAGAHPAPYLATRLAAAANTLKL